MSSNTTMILVVVCIVCACVLACGVGITIFVVSSGGVENALNKLTGGGKPGSGWKLTASDCDTNGKQGVLNAAGRCVPLEVESEDLGSSSGGSYLFRECPTGEYIDTMAAGYDEGNQELKWMAASCSGGQYWSRGNSAPGKFTGTDGSTGSVGSGTSFDNRYWRDPANPGWDQVAYVANTGKYTKGLVRAFGPRSGSNGSEMFGINDNKSKQNPVPDTDKKVWRCDKAGTAPAGKRYAIVGVGAASGTAVDRFRVKCRLFDTA